MPQSSPGAGWRWTLCTAAHTVPLVATAGVLAGLDPITIPVGLILLGHAWAIPELYAARGAKVARGLDPSNQPAEKVAAGRPSVPDSATVRPTLYEFAGGEPAFLALAAAHHARCLADPELNHPFSHADLNPAHVQRLAVIAFFFIGILAARKRPRLRVTHIGQQPAVGRTDGFEQ